MSKKLPLFFPGSGSRTHIKLFYYIVVAHSCAIFNVDLGQQHVTGVYHYFYITS